MTKYVFLDQVRFNSSRDNRPTVLVGQKANMWGPTSRPNVPAYTGPTSFNNSVPPNNYNNSAHSSSGFGSVRLPTSSQPITEKPTSAFGKKIDELKKISMEVK